MLDPNLAIFVVSLMENDDGHPESLRAFVKGVVGGSLLASLSFERFEKEARLVSDIKSALTTPTGAPNFDDSIGGPQVLQFTAQELATVIGDRKAWRSLNFSGDGGQYILTFEASAPIVVNPGTGESGGDPGTCFAAGTLVLMVDGSLRPIESVKEGEMVTANAEDEVAACRVVGVNSHLVSGVTRLQLVSGRFLDTTSDHRIAKHASGFVPVSDLSSGIRLHAIGSPTGLSIEAVSRVETPQTVYNLEVERFHTNFVSEDRILVHNMKNRH